MQIIENSKVKEKFYIQKLDNKLTIMIMPKETRKKYIVWSTNFGSIDNKFYEPENNEYKEVPDGIAHYLEHKLFEQENGKNSLDVLTSIGVDANAYTTNDHTAYLFECTENFDEALDEFMDYVQNPYFTDENVEKERGIIEQEIMMYKDYPEWELYMNALKCMYKNNEINIDVAGTKETIAKITPEKLYDIYNAFYSPENMIIVLAGDFKPEEVLEKIKQRITLNSRENNVKRVYNKEPEEIVQNYVEEKMDVSMPSIIVGYKDNDLEPNKVRKDIALQIIGNILYGKGSNFYKKMYEEGKILSEPSFNYEYSKTFAHLLIQFQTDYIDDVLKESDNQIDVLKENGITEESFLRAKRKVYGEFIKAYNDVEEIASLTVADFFKGIKPFEYIEEFSTVSKEYVEVVLKEILSENKKVISVIKPYDN